MSAFPDTRKKIPASEESAWQHGMVRFCSVALQGGILEPSKCPPEGDVTVSPNDYTRLTSGKTEPEELVRRSFEFLLEREPKESILTRFDLSVIGRYFPEYEKEIKRRLT
jgi:hypothetical protein